MPHLAFQKTFPRLLCDFKFLAKKKIIKILIGIPLSNRIIIVIEYRNRIIIVMVKKISKMFSLFDKC